MKQNSGKRTAPKGNGVVQKTTNKNSKKRKFKNTSNNNTYCKYY